jgi:hypothetical protein
MRTVLYKKMMCFMGLHPDIPCIINPQKRTFRGKQLHEYVNTLTLTPLQKEVLVGTLLGDASLFRTLKTSGLGMKVEQKASQADYVYALFECFEPFVGTPPTLYQKRKKDGTYSVHSSWFRTYKHPSFQFYAHQFYEINALGARRKKVPKLIHRWLTPLSLAVWFQDDGSKTPYGYTLNTQGFHLFEQKRLQKALGSVFGLQSTIQKDKTYYRLYIGAASRDRFTQVVTPHMVKSMMYKLHS